MRTQVDNENEMPGILTGILLCPNNAFWPHVEAVSGDGDGDGDG